MGSFGDLSLVGQWPQDKVRVQLQARDRTTYLCMRHCTGTPAVLIFGGLFKKFACSLLCAHIVRHPDIALTDTGISDSCFMGYLLFREWTVEKLAGRPMEPEIVEAAGRG